MQKRRGLENWAFETFRKRGKHEKVRYIDTMLTNLMDEIASDEIIDLTFS